MGVRVGPPKAAPAVDAAHMAVHGQQQAKVVPAAAAEVTASEVGYILKLDIDQGAAWDKVFNLAAAAAAESEKLGAVHKHYQAGRASIQSPGAVRGHLPHMTLKYWFSGSKTQLATLCQASCRLA